MDPLLICFGCVVGLLVGLTGVGGGSLMTPLLLIAGYSRVIAIGTDLLYGAVTKTVGGWRHLSAGHVDLRLSRWLAYGSVPGSLAGVLTSNALSGAHGDEPQPYLLGAVAVALLLAWLSTLYRALFRPGLLAKERDAAVLERRVSKVGTVAIGATLGFVLGVILFAAAAVSVKAGLDLPPGALAAIPLLVAAAVYVLDRRLALVHRTPARRAEAAA